MRYYTEYIQLIYEKRIRYIFGKKNKNNPYQMQIWALQAQRLGNKRKNTANIIHNSKYMALFWPQ